MTRLIALFVLGLTATAFARPQGPPPGPPPIGEMVLRHADELGLDEATVQAVEALVSDAEADREADKEAMKAHHDAMRALMDADDFDADAVRAQHAKVQAMRAEAATERLETTIELRLLLGTEAWQQLHAAMPKPGERGPRGQGERRGPPQR
jgi:Spy/CpxP family protein refolding chaperone